MASEKSTAEYENPLEQVLDLEEIDTDLFRGFCPEKPRWGRIYGGQTISQALVAAGRTVPAPFQVHSLHLNFMRAGNDTQAVLYNVVRSFDGKSFCSRFVRVRQSGHTIATVQLSFQKPETGLEHQIQAPQVPSPNGVLSNKERLLKIAEDKSQKISEKKRAVLRAMASLPFPMEMREILPSDYPPEQRSAMVQQRQPLFGLPDSARPSGPNVKPVPKTQWVRTIELGDSCLLHNAALAYLSDWGLLEAALRPHGVRSNDRRLQIASLDHSMWFHKAFRADKWLLFDMDSQRAAGGRGLVVGRFYQDGELVVTVAQEGLIRLRPSAVPRPPNRMAVPSSTRGQITSKAEERAQAESSTDELVVEVTSRL